MSYNLIKKHTTCNYSSGNTGRKYIVIHYTGNSTDTAAANANYFYNVNRGASAHYFVDKNDVYEVVAPENTSWAVGVNYGSNNLFNSCKNKNSISIEMCSDGGKIADATFNNTVELTKKLMATYNIPSTNVVRHYDVCTKSCPGWTGWVGSNTSIWDKFKNEISSTKPADPDGEVTNGGVTQSSTDKHGKVDYQVHTRKIGWMAWQCDGDMAGTTGQSRRIEALHINPIGQLDVTVHMKGIGDKKFSNVNKDTLIGTTNEQRRIEAIKLESSDTLYSYRVQQKKKGWSDWKLNGQVAGVTGQALQAEALEIKVADLAYRSHVQSVGWTNWVTKGVESGTTGQGKRLEAIQINPCDMEVSAKAHIQSIGWKDYGVITKDTVIGTTGEGKRLECLCLKGDFEYRAHIQGTGWTAWTKADGVATIGTVGEDLRIEAIQFR